MLLKGEDDGKRALAAFVDAYRGIESGAATPALDDAYDLAKEVLERNAEAEGGEGRTTDELLADCLREYSRAVLRPR